MTFDQQVAEISAWLDRKNRTPPEPGYRLTYVIPIKGTPRFEWRKVLKKRG